ncbi:MAG: filamentous hemagglutinin N-terminal domain-containing protein [Cyanobacteriota bacterium]|nr:filamentous hemagglutinin N-terminal domain-containing protein [Cyanobacteriota bacterium]
MTLNFSINRRQQLRMPSGLFPLWAIAFLLGIPASALAQIVPDGTLPNNSTITVEDTLQRISGGTEAGGNLFHSFQEFNVPTLGTAYFDNAVTIDNIITRVTGGNLSSIDGLIRANGTANLFLINPAGIVFGPNASLNIGGSFLGSSAESIFFTDGSEFSATAPNPDALLTINIPIGLQMGANPGPIVVRGDGVSGTVPGLEDRALSVTPLNTLALVGGDVTLAGGILSAFSGRIEVGSAANTRVNLNPVLVGWQLGYEETPTSRFGAVQLVNRSSLWNPNVGIEALAGVTTGGGIQVQAGTLEIDRSQIAAIALGNVRADDITLNATESIELRGTVLEAFPFSSWVVNQVGEGAPGDSGNVTVNTPQLRAFDGGTIQTLSQGAGNAGAVEVNADSILLSGSAPPDPSGNPVEQILNSRIASETLGSGNGGPVRVNATQMTLLDGGQVASSVFPPASGNGGNITLSVSESITATGIAPTNPTLGSGIQTVSLGAGNSGDIEVSAGALNFFEGGGIFSFNQGTGLGGNIAVNVADSIGAVEVNPAIPTLPSGITSFTVSPRDGGNVDVTAGRVNLSGGGSIGAFTLVQLAGEPLPGGGEGNTGNVTVNARESIEISGASALAPDRFSLLGTTTLAAGDAGDVNVSTPRLSITDGGGLLSAVVPSFSSLGAPLPTSGTGNGGNVTVNASESIFIAGVNPVIDGNTVLGTTSLGRGNGGNVVVRTPRLTVRTGGTVNAGTLASGNAGTVDIEASEIVLEGDGLPDNNGGSISVTAFIPSPDFRQAFFLPDVPTGNTGALRVKTDRLSISDGGFISARHNGTGDAGDLFVEANSISMSDGAGILATTVGGQGGNIVLNVEESLQLRRGSGISAEALSGVGDGGNLTIDAETIVALENSDIIANAVGGNGGNIEITTQGLFGTEFRSQLTPESDITASSQFAANGVVQVNQPNVDPASGLVDLPTSVTDPSDRIGRGCEDYADSAFVATGRGGLTEEPMAVIRGQTIWEDWQYFGEASTTSTNDNPVSAIVESSPAPVVEATGWRTNESGQVELIAHHSPNFSLKFPECSDLNSES